MPYPALAIANYFVVKSLHEGRQLDPLKLQKLIYFANGFHLALYDEPLIDEPIKAWQYGPVIESVYHAFKAYGSREIDQLADCHIEVIDEQTRELLDQVWELYGGLTGVQLSNLSHATNGPWFQARRKSSRLNLSPRLSDVDMRNYFVHFVGEQTAGRR